MRITNDDKKPPLDEAIEHYGVKGMKWGVRRDQATLDKAAGRTKEGSSDKKTGVVGVDPVLVTYGALVATALISKKVMLYRDSGVKDARKTGDKEFKKNQELTKKMPSKELQDKVVKQVNPGFPAPGTKMNCRRATMAYEMRRRGHDVKATQSKHASGQDPKGMEKSVGVKFKDSLWGEKQISNKTTMHKSSPEERSKLVFDSLSKNPDGARGELGVSWAFGGGHSLAWEIVDNKPVIFDAQSGEMYTNKEEFSDFTTIVLDAAETRLDNKTIDDEFIKRWVTDV